VSAGNEELQEALEQIDMEAWLDRQGLDYKKARGSRGLQLNVKECPVCGNSNWKVYLNADSGLGNCFAGDCEKKYNRWSFIRAVLGDVSTRDVVDHVKHVAAEQGWRPPNRDTAPVKMQGELKLPQSVELPHNGRNVKYLENRGIDAGIAKYFHLRLCVKGGFAYEDQGEKRFQSYAHRIIIPIFDMDGNLVSFQGRDITGESPKKYLFPPGYASTGAFLFNGQNAIGAESIVINEGVFDVAATKIAFDQDMHLRKVVPVGSFGKHLSSGDDESQLAKLMRLKEHGLKMVTFMWDGEDRAIRDAVDAALEVRKIGLIARVAILPKDKDPNEVPASVVRNAYWKAETVNAATAAKLKLKHQG